MLHNNTLKSLKVAAVGLRYVEYTKSKIEISITGEHCKA